MTTVTNHPHATIRDGRLKATIWKNESENGEFFSIEFTRTYTNSEDKPQDTRSFSKSDLLRVARLAGKVYDFLEEVKTEDKGIE